MMPIANRRYGRLPVCATLGCWQNRYEYGL